jgi:hypothetical protein
MIDKLVRFSRDTHCFEQGPIVPSNFTIPAGSVGIVLCKDQCVGRTQDYRTSYEILVDGKILFEIEPRSLTILSEGECL